MDKCSGDSISYDVRIAIASGHLVKQSMHVSRYEYPRDGRSGLTMSTWILSKRNDASGNATNGVIVCRWTLAHWHLRHERVHWQTSALMCDQTYRDVTERCVARMSGWESE